MKTSAIKTPRLRETFLVDHVAQKRERGGQGSGMLHFHLELPLPHNHPPLGPSTKISKVPEYPFTWDGGGDLVVYNPSARIYHEQLWHLRGMIFRDQGGRGRRILWADGGKGGWDRERENKTESRDRELYERRGRRGRAACREGGQEEGGEREREGEKGRATSARSRATIGDHLPSSAVLLVVLDLSGRRQRGLEKSTTRRIAAAIIKLFTHTVRYLSSKQRDHNVLLFDPHFVSDLSLTASRDDMYLADPARSIWSTSHDLARQLPSGVGERIARRIRYYVSVARMLFPRSDRNSNMRAESKHAASNT